MSTNNLSAREVRREWHLIDAKDQILGRLASRVATILIGKNKPYYVPYLDSGDNVVVINASLVKVSGQKETKKEYVRHSGFPGGLKKQTLGQVRSSHPEELIRHAVWGMVPKGKLGRQIIKKLYVFSGVDHPFGDKVKGLKDAK